MKNALVDVIGRMNRVRSMPQDADRPVVQLGGGNGDDSNESLLVVLRAAAARHARTDRELPPLHREHDQAAHRIGARRRMVIVNAGPPDDVRITVDLAKAAAMGIGIPDIASARRDPIDVSGGQIEVGRQQYELRYTGRYKPEDLGELVLSWRDGKPIQLGDVATVEMQPPEAAVLRLPERQSGDRPGRFARAGRERARHAGAVKKVVAELRDWPAEGARASASSKSFDSSLFINRAVNLLTENLIVGALLSLLLRLVVHARLARDLADRERDSDLPARDVRRARSPGTAST